MECVSQLIQYGNTVIILENNDNSLLNLLKNTHMMMSYHKTDTHTYYIVKQIKQEEQPVNDITTVMNIDVQEEPVNDTEHIMNIDVEEPIIVQEPIILQEEPIIIQEEAIIGSNTWVDVYNRVKLVKADDGSIKYSNKNTLDQIKNSMQRFIRFIDSNDTFKLEDVTDVGNYLLNVENIIRYNNESTHSVNTKSTTLALLTECYKCCSNNTIDGLNKYDELSRCARSTFKSTLFREPTQQEVDSSDAFIKIDSIYNEYYEKFIKNVDTKLSVDDVKFILLHMYKYIDPVRQCEYVNMKVNVNGDDFNTLDMNTWTFIVRVHKTVKTHGIRTLVVPIESRQIFEIYYEKLNKLGSQWLLPITKRAADCIEDGHIDHQRVSKLLTQMLDIKSPVRSFRKIAVANVEDKSAQDKIQLAYNMGHTIDTQRVIYTALNN